MTWIRKRTSFRCSSVRIFPHKRHGFRCQFREILKKRQLIEVRKHYKPTGNPNNEYHLLSLDNPEIYRDLDPVDDDELPLSIDGDAA